MNHMKFHNVCSRILTMIVGRGEECLINNEKDSLRGISFLARLESVMCLPRMPLC